MINLPVDEAYAFDYLAILEIKKSWDAIALVSDSLRRQLGDNKYLSVIHSEQYAAMINVNQTVFDNVDRAKKNLITAAELDTSNYARYTAKIALQKKFFTNDLTEKKI